MTELCSVRSREAGEPLAGTAGAPATLVAISWPKPRWDPDEAFQSTGLPVELADVVARAKQRGRKLAFRTFQRAPRPSTERVEAFLLAPREGRAAHERDLPLADLASRIEAFAAGEPASAPPPPLLLVCTDGQHDRCCATHGREMLEALDRELAARGRPFALAESSHLGGHRFAATCLMLPSGLMHGRLAPPDAGSLVDALAAGRPLVPRYRGCVGGDEAQQAAEAWALREFAGARVLDVGAAETAGDRLHVPVSIAVGAEARCTVVECAPREFAGSTSCGPPSDERRVRWVAIREAR